MLLSINLISIANSIPVAISQGLVWGIMVLGVYITFKLLDFADLTVDGSFALGGIVAAVFITGGMNPFLALLVSMLAGFAAGAVTGILHTKCKIPAILAGILSMIALYSINLRVAGGIANVPLLGVDTYTEKVEMIPFFGNLPSRIEIGPFAISSSVLITILVGFVICALIISIMYWFFGTEIGSIIRATGCNEQMVRAQGANTDTTKIIALALSNGLVAMSGGLAAQSQGYGDVGMGIGTIIIGLAAVIIGEVVFCHKIHSFAYTLISVVLGSILYYITINVALQVGLKTSDLKLITAIIVALALSIPTIKAKINGRKHKRKIPVPINKGVDDLA